ncbi:MAG TPA: DUF4190 domain-containing protein [Frankiaceae bacterium]|nr:DUF4190 domain-containing protein [Frankiaceae bacterium]
MTTPSDPPQDPWQHAPGMSPEQPQQPGPYPPPGQGDYGGQPGYGAPPAGQPGYGAPGGQPGYGAPPAGPPGFGPPGQPGYGQPGAPGQWGQPGYAQQPPARNGMSIASLVLGILGLLTSVFIVGGFFGLLALIFGIIGVRRVGASKAMSIIGMFLGAVSIGVAIFVAAVAGEYFDEFAGLTDCLANADTPAEERACETQFEDDINAP